MADEQPPPLVSPTAEIDALRRQVEILRAQLDRLRTLSTVDHLVTTLADVLDVRQIFGRIAEIAREVLPHDGMLIGQVVDEGRRVRMYATHGLGAATIEVPNLSPQLMTEPWEFLLIDDIAERPDLADSTVARFGMRSAVFVPVRLGGTFWGGLSVYGKQVGQFTEHDVLVVKRIADYLMLGLSHHGSNHGCAR